MLQWVELEEDVPVWTAALLTKDSWRAVLQQVQLLEERDTWICRRNEQRAVLEAELQRLEEIRERVEDLRTRVRVHEGQVVDEQNRIDGFDEANADLIADVEAEAIARELEVRIQEGYEHFLAAIKAYRDGLPAGLLADLNETTKELYNSFNPHDHHNDLLAELTLPQRGGERITVAFAGTPTQRHDALAVLSEGHLRCLGLAILLAKNIKLNLPLVVFDDAVNAIDHDHRKGIRDTLFHDERLRDKQMIITCHSNNFITQVQNGLDDGVYKLYVLRPHAGDHQPRVKHGSDRHYLRRAINRPDDGDDAQAMASARQAMENLAARTWADLLKDGRDLAGLRLLMRSPKGEPELRNLVEVLLGAVTTGIRQGRLVDPKWPARQESMRLLLGVPEASLAWSYLNTGAHDNDGDEFESGFVEEIIGALETISATFPAEATLHRIAQQRN